MGIVSQYELFIIFYHVFGDFRLNMALKTELKKIELIKENEGSITFVNCRLVSSSTFAIFPMTREVLDFINKRTIGTN